MKNPILLVSLAMIGLIACTKSESPLKPTVKTPRERTVSISAKPNFKKESIGKDHHYFTFEIEGPEGGRSIVWPDDAPKPGDLDQNRSYTLELVEEEFTSSHEPITTYWSPELVKLHDGQKLLYDASVCRVHQTQMDRKLVKISYGLPSFTPEWTEIMKNAPNDGTVFGGCCVDSDRPETRTWVCPVCKSIHDDFVARISKKNR